MFNANNRFGLRSILFNMLAAFAAMTLISSHQKVFAADACKKMFAETDTIASKKQILKDRGDILPERNLTIKKLAEFAEKYKLPYQWVDFGPSDRKIKRLLVAVDITNEPLMTAYRDTFNLDTPLNKTKSKSGTLVIEQTWETPKRPEHYVYTYIRAFSKPSEPVYRWGQRDDSWTASFSALNSKVIEQESGLIGIAHLIEVNGPEIDNVKIFLDTPALRGPCKSDNCVAWLTGTELGKTTKESTDEQRKYLFNELGISRTIAPFEISRRLTHASNERHGALAVFVKGEIGLKTFKENLYENLIPEPKIPYAAILKNYTTANPAQKAVSIVNDGEKIFVPIAAGASPEAVDALIKRSTELANGIDLHVLVNGISAQTFRKGVETTDGKFRVHALFLGGNLRELYKEKKVTVIPGNLSDFTRTMREPNQNEFNYSTILVRVSEANAEGFHSLGPNHDMIMTILENRPNIKIIAEINPNIPFTKGTNRIHKDRINASFHSKTELAGPTTVPTNEIDATIGRSIGQLVDSGATLQIGIGNIFGGVPEGLKLAGKNNIKISTEMFGDHMMQMMTDGTAVEADAGFAFGSMNLYKWLNHNEKVNFVATEDVNSPGRIAATPKFHAVNTALQIDLYGQVNATMGPDGRISSPGGQVEFMTGAARSAGGKAIIAIRSTAKNETISSISLNLYDGPITTPHESVTHVITEYGVAELRGRTETQRAIALINIAHPKFRMELFNQAVQRGMLQAKDANKIVLAGATHE